MKWMILLFFAAAAALADPAPPSTALVTHADTTVTPYIASADTDSARGTALDAAFSDLAAGETLTIGPGTYLLPHRLWKNAYFGDFSGQKVHGAGIGVTVIKLGDVGFPRTGIAGYTAANSAVVTTDAPHQLQVGDTVPVTGAVPSSGGNSINGMQTVTAIGSGANPTTFTIAVDTSGGTGGGAAGTVGSDMRNGDRVIQWYSNSGPCDGIELTDLTVDCNLQGQSNHNASQAAVNIFGSHIRIARVAEINIGTKGIGAENFGIGIGTGGHSGNFSDVEIRDCIAVAATCAQSGTQGQQPFIVAGYGIPLQYATGHETAPPPWVAIDHTEGSDGGATTTIFTTAPHGMFSDKTPASAGTYAGARGCAIRAHSAASLNGRLLAAITAAVPSPVQLTIIDDHTFKVPVAYVPGVGGEVIAEVNWGWDARIINCQMWDSGTGGNRPFFLHGASIGGVDGGLIEGCHMENLLQFGSGFYQDTGPCYHVTVRGCTLRNLTHAMQLDADATVHGLTIEDCEIFCTPNGATPSFAIQIVPAAPGDGLIIRRNRIHGPDASYSGAYGIIVGHLDNVRIEDNIIDNCALPIYDAGALTHAYEHGNFTSGGTSVGTPSPPWQQWQVENFGDHWSNATLTGPTVVTAGDGLTNLAKYALGLPAALPAIPSVALAPSGPSWTFTYRRPANRADITYAVEISPNFAPDSWTASGVTHTRLTPGDPETWQASFPPGSASRLFFQLKITKP